jgi:phytoene dehydrogenase-like protein
VTRIVIVGGGHNGLVGATLLARSGVKVLVLERRAVVGGAALVANSVHLSADLFKDLRLSEHGVELIEPDPYLFAPLPDGRSLTLSRDVGASASSIAQFSDADARRYPDYCDTLGRIGAAATAMMAMTPPDIEQPSRTDLWTLLKMGRRVQKLSKRDAYRLFRWAPASAADFATEWFESEPLRAAIAAQGVFGTAFGPRSAGSAAVLLMRLAAGDGVPRLVRGGLGRLTEGLASAARVAGADVRTDADVARINVTNGRVTSVTLASGDTLDADVIVSNADPRRTMLGLVDPAELEPDFLTRMRSYRALGTVAKINLTLRSLPSFAAASKDARVLGGFIHIGPSLDYIEKAFDASKYGEYSPSPRLDITIPSIADPSLAPAGGHVMSVTAQYAPYRVRGGWDAARDAFADRVVDTLAQYAPDVKSLIAAREIMTPADLESVHGLTGGHIFHGELALDQLFTMRPLLGWARYRTPIEGLYLCGAGTHPGYGVSGRSGANAARQILKDLTRV